MRLPLTLGCVLLAVCCLLGVGCGRGDERHEAAPSTRPEPGGTAVIAFPAEPDVLNSLIRTTVSAGQILALIQDGLADMGEDLIWRPRIAESWTVAGDGQSLTYRLRPWFWSDGAPLTAYDVVATFTLFNDPVIASPRRGSFRHVTEAAVLDSFTVRYLFDRVLPDAVGRTAHAILPVHVTAGLDPMRVREWPLNQHPLASGPFRLERWVHDDQIVLVPNSRYAGPQPLLERVVLRIIPDETARLLALEAGEVDFVEELPYGAAARLEAEGAIELQRVQGRLYGHLTYNFANPLFGDRRVRRAISVAIDRDRFVNGLLYGFGAPAASLLPPALWNHDANLAADPYRPEEARRLLAEAGWIDADGDGVRERDGVRFSFAVITRKGDPIRENGIVVIRENLRQIGIEVRPRVMEHAAGIELVSSGRFDAYLGVFQADLGADPSALIRSDARDRFNYGGYANARVDSLLALATVEADRARAKPLWDQIQALLAVDPPAAFLYYPEIIHGFNPRLRGVRSHLLSPYNNLHEWWIPPTERKYRSPSAE